jgi:predicted TIM-barrel fold metal-dependent hydrolase
MRYPLFALALLAAACKPRPIPKLDVHTHISPGGMAHAVALLEANGIGGAVNLSGGDRPDVLAAQVRAARTAPVRIVTFANLDFEQALEPGWVDAQVAWLSQAKQMGARGLKIFKSFGLEVRDPTGARVAVDDARLDPIFEAAGKLGFPVAIHVGDPKAFFDPIAPQNERYDELSLNPGWSFADRSLYPDWETLFGEFERLVARHPHTTFIGVHFGNDPEQPARVAELLARCHNLYVDTAARVGEIGRTPPDKLRAIFVANRDRILFGTDIGVGRNHLTLGAPEPWPVTDQDAPRFFQAHWRFFETGERGLAHPTPIQGRWTVDGISLPREVLEDLYHRNAERLFGLPKTTIPAGQARP